MPHPRNVEPSVRLGCWIPQSLSDRLQLQAYSALHGKIPPKGLTEIVSAALKLYFDVLDRKKAVNDVQSRDQSRD
jgi:hypothetical protein